MGSVLALKNYLEILSLIGLILITVSQGMNTLSDIPHLVWLF